MSLPLSKTLDPADFVDLAEELTFVDAEFTAASEQHPMRRWEYAMALRAFDQWAGGARHQCVDVGGAGSPFWQMLPADNVDVIDPKENHDLASYLHGMHHPPTLYDAAFCLSVLEHVEDLDQFVYHLGCLVRPGGLLFLTFDACQHGRCTTPDSHHFHWMRERIFGAADRYDLRMRLARHCFSTFGEIDEFYAGDHVYNYSFASLALVKRA